MHIALIAYLLTYTGRENTVLREHTWNKTNKLLFHLFHYIIYSTLNALTLERLHLRFKHQLQLACSMVLFRDECEVRSNNIR